MAGAAASSPHEPPTGVAVVIPVKTFDLAKGRLAESLTGEQRAALARTMAERVVAAAAPLPVHVVCGSDEVETWAQGLGASVIRLDQPGLNRAVTHACSVLAADGHHQAIVAHGDLPLARSLAWLAVSDAINEQSSEQIKPVRELVSIVTDRRGDGTNVMAVPLGVGFEFHYGPGSAAAHRAEAERLGLRWRIIEDPELGWDVDTPADLAALDQLEHTEIRQPDSKET